jgi:hypothetical protein
LSILGAVLMLMAVAACGKVGAPEPPGPPDQIHYPKFYPTQ